MEFSVVGEDGKPIRRGVFICPAVLNPEVYLRQIAEAEHIGHLSIRSILEEELRQHSGEAVSDILQDLSTQTHWLRVVNLPEED